MEKFFGFLTKGQALVDSFQYLVFVTRKLISFIFMGKDQVAIGGAPVVADMVKADL